MNYMDTKQALIIYFLGNKMLSGYLGIFITINYIISKNNLTNYLSKYMYLPNENSATEISKLLLPYFFIICVITSCF